MSTRTRTRARRRNEARRRGSAAPVARDAEPRAAAGPRPELSVAFTPDAETVQRLRRADASGSADAAYALGLWLAQRGERDEAAAALRRADVRGSAEGAHAVGLLLAQEGRRADAAAAWRRGEERGSPAAAHVLASLAEQAGERDRAAAAWKRALRLAERADREGSADAACIVAQIRGRRGDTAASRAAWRRADRRGSGWASYVVSKLAFEHGDARRAEVAAARAAERGIAAGAYETGLFLSERGEHSQARAAWRRAKSLAARQGDVATLRAAQKALRPSGRLWLRTHPWLAAAVLLIVAALAILVGVLAAAAAAAAFAGVYWWRRPLAVGAPIAELEETSMKGLPGVSAGGLTLVADIGAWKEPSEARRRRERPATARDRRYFRFWPALVIAAAGVLAARAAGALGADAVPRLLYAAIALSSLWSLAWSAPSALAAGGSEPTPTDDDDDQDDDDQDDDDQDDDDQDDDDTVRVALLVTPSQFYGFVLRFSISNPRLAPLVAWVRARRRANPGGAAKLRSVRSVLGLAAVGLTGAFFLALAVSREPGSLAAGVAGVASSVVQMAVVAVGVLACLRSAVRAPSAHEAWRGLGLSVLYILAAALVIVVGTALGMLEPWREVWQAVAP